MKKNSLKFTLSLSVALFSFGVNAQDTRTDNHTISITVPEIALLDIEPTASKNITLGYTSPTEAGEPIIPGAANTSLWLNYSSIKSTADPLRTVSVKLSAVIPGVDIKVTAAAATGTGGGTLGLPSSTALILTASDQTIISGIGSAYTGNGANNGHNLTYVLSSGGIGAIANYADLEAASSTTITVTYTISDI